MKKVMLVFGTRPEAIKMCPLVLELKSRRDIKTLVCVTGQHRQMLDAVLNTFGVVPDYDLSIMKESQTLFDITQGVLAGMRTVLGKENPDMHRRRPQKTIFCGKGRRQRESSLPVIPRLTL